MVPGDALSTARQSLAEIRFNEGSLARIGERTVFQFVPRTRIFRLSNGTALLLIPPGRGETRVRTPNAVAGIRGSALFVRYVPETDTTLVGALTDSGIQVSNGDYSQNQPLPAGQVAVIVKNQITQVYTFDLKTFYETSELVKDLQLSNPQVKNGDVDIQAVRDETVAALQDQQAKATLNAVINPGRLLDLTEVLSTTSSQALSLTGATPSVRNGRPNENSNSGINSPGSTVSSPSPVSSQPGAEPGAGSGPSLQSPQPTIVSPQQSNPLPVSSNPGQGANPGPANNGAPGSVFTPSPSSNPASSVTLPPSFTFPGQGQGNSLAPGQNGTAPGLVGTTPGQSGNLPPGQGGLVPGQTFLNPGRANQINRGN
jgi:hypothetical protein